MAQKVRNADYTKEYNRKAVLGILRRQPMSRAELARATGLTRAATSLIVEDLLLEGFVAELPPQSVGRGRSGTPLTVQSDCYYALGVELARKGCSVGLSDLAGNLLQYEKITSEEDPVGAIIAQLEKILETVDRSRVLGIGISSPGRLDRENGRILNPPRFERWHGVEIGHMLSEALGLPAYLEHDVCSLALHQLEKSQSRDFMMVFVESGIGAAIVSGGRLLGDSKYFTGELGHTTIRFDGRLCECGSRGCLETYAAIPRLLDGSEFPTWKALVDSLETSAEARKLLDQEAVYLSAGVINLLNLIPVDTLYLAGEVLYGFDKLAQRMQRQLGTKLLDRSRKIRIYPADHCPEIGVLAAANVVFYQFLTV